MKSYTLQTLQNENFKVSDLTEEEYSLLVNLPYTRKAGYLDDVEDRLTADDITDELVIILNKLPLIEVKDEIDSFDDFLYAYIFDADVQFYRVYVNGMLLLIDTQGYQYGRYALILDVEQKDFSTVETDLDYSEIIAQMNREIKHLQNIIDSKDRTINVLKETVDNLTKLV